MPYQAQTLAILETLMSISDTIGLNAERDVISSAATATNTKWLQQPVFSRSYVVRPYVSDTIIDASLTLGDNIMFDCGGSAISSNRAFSIASGPPLHVTPYMTSNGLACSTAQTLDELVMWVKYLANTG